MIAEKQDLVIFTAVIMFLVVCAALYDKLFVLLIIVYASLVAVCKATTAKQRRNLFACAAEFFDSIKR